MKALLAILLFVTVGGAGCAQAQPPFPNIERYTGRLELPNGDLCSGTRHYRAIITSTHCMTSQPKQVRFQGILVNVTRTWADGENIYVYTDRNWGRPPRMAKTPRKGEPLYMIGNAAGFDQIARVMNMAGTTDRPVQGVDVQLIACGGCWHGDSGAGVFNAQGEMVGVFLGSYTFNQRESAGAVSVFSIYLAVPVRKAT